jgi:biopolymer transport protein ExbB
MSKQGSSFKDALQSIFATSAILIAFIVSYYLFTQIMGDPINFVGGNPKGEAMPGNYEAIIYKGGIYCSYPYDLRSCTYHLHF